MFGNIISTAVAMLVMFYLGHLGHASWHISLIMALGIGVAAPISRIIRNGVNPRWHLYVVDFTTLVVVGGVLYLFR